MTYYRATTYGNIEPVEVISETKAFVVLAKKGMSGKPMREAKWTEWHSFHKTREEAQEWILKGLRHDVKMAEARLAQRRRDLAEFERKFAKAVPC